MPLVCCLCFAFSCALQFYAAMCFQVGCASHWPMGRTVATCADVSSPRGHVMHCADVSTGELTWPLESERGPQLISPAPLALLCRGHCHSSCVREYTDLRHQGQVLQRPLHHRQRRHLPGERIRHESTRRRGGTITIVIVIVIVVSSSSCYHHQCTTASCTCRAYHCSYGCDIVVHHVQRP